VVCEIIRTIFEYISDDIMWELRGREGGCCSFVLFFWVLLIDGEEEASVVVCFSVVAGTGIGTWSDCRRRSFNCRREICIDKKTF
jgi:hypothetical protein